MLKKILIALALLMGLQSAQCQITIAGSGNARKQFAILEINGSSIANGNVVVYFEDGKTEDITSDLNTNKYASGNFKSQSRNQKGLTCINYMSEKGYKLISSTLTYPNQNGLNYISQYIFEKS